MQDLTLEFDTYNDKREVDNTNKSYKNHEI